MKALDEIIKALRGGSNRDGDCLSRIAEELDRAREALKTPDTIASCRSQIDDALMGDFEMD